MTEDRHAIERKASREASGWLIRLQEEPENVELRRQFDEWLVDSVNATAWAETERMSRAVAGGSPAHAQDWGPFLGRLRHGAAEAEGCLGGPLRLPLSDATDRVAKSARTRATVARPDRRRVLGLGGLAAAAAVLALVVGPDLGRSPDADYVTGTAEVRSLRLTDGSLVTLAPKSALSVGGAGDARHVRLLAGEAFFEVTAAPERPFRVAAGEVQVTVLGTAFNVNRGKAGAEVGVAHGSVRVDYAGSFPTVAETLAAGEFLRVGWSGRIARGERPVSQAAAWRHDQLIAQDQALGEVLDRLRRYYAGAIVVTDDTLLGQPVTGVYDLADPVRALRGIVRSQKAVVRGITPWLLVVSRF